MNYSNEFIRNGVNLVVYELYEQTVINEYVSRSKNLFRIENPKLLFLAGAPNSGKSTITRAEGIFYESNNYIIVSQDDIKSRMQELLCVSKHLVKEWREVYQEESWRITEKILVALLDLQVNIVYDSTLGNPAKSKMLIDYSSSNYTFELDVVYADLEIILQRNNEREGHHVPEAAIVKIFNKIPQSICELLPYLERITIWDNSEFIPAGNDNYESLLMEKILLNMLFDRDDMQAVILNLRISELEAYLKDSFYDFNEYISQFELVTLQTDD